MTPRVFAPAVLSGLLLWTAYFPLDLGPVAAVALAPVLTLVRAENARRRYLAAYCGGLAFFLFALQWIRVAHPAMYASWVGLSLVCALWWPATIFLLRRLDRLGRPPLALTVPVVWVALEYLRAHVPTGFPFLRPLGAYQLTGFAWYFLGHALHSILPIIQIADLGGVYLISLLVAATNGAAAEWATRFAWVRRLLRWPAEYRPGFVREMWVTAGVATGICLAVGYGTQRVQHPEFVKGPRVAAIQASVPQDTKMEKIHDLFQTYDHLARTAAARADLVVWPETCYPYHLVTVTPGTDPATADDALRTDIAKSRAVLRRAAAEWRVPTLLGLARFEWDGTTEWRYNSAVLVASDGTPEAVYDKQHLVPFGEYVPMGKTFPWLQAFTPYKGEYSCRPGETYTRFDLAVGEQHYTFGCLICYEDSDPYLARQFVRPGQGPPVDFLVNISNDGWFRGTEQHEQHLAICRFRAVEARRSVVRAVNMGISAIIDPDGRIVALPGDDWRSSKKLVGTVTDKVPIDDRASFYAANGDWVPAGCWIVLLFGLMASRRAKQG